VNDRKIQFKALPPNPRLDIPRPILLDSPLFQENLITTLNKGKIVQVIGPVVDIEFPDDLPSIYGAVTVDFDVPGAGKTKLTLEVQQHLGDHWVRSSQCPALRASSAAWKSSIPARPFQCQSAPASWVACSMSPASRGMNAGPVVAEKY